MTSQLSSFHAKTDGAIGRCDQEVFDEAFLNEVAQVEARYSPMQTPTLVSSPSTPLSSLHPKKLLPFYTEPYIEKGKRLQTKLPKFFTPLSPNSSSLHSSSAKISCKKLDFGSLEDAGSGSSCLPSWYITMQQSTHSDTPSLEMLGALGELPQLTALLVLSRFRSQEWANLLTVDELRRYKVMEFAEIDGRLQQHAGSTRLSRIDWSKKKGRHMVFHCEVSTEGSYTIKGPHFEPTDSPLQRVFGEGGVIRVHFAGPKRNPEIVEGIYRKVAREGIWVGPRLYMFFAYKDPKGKKKQALGEEVLSVPKCFFVCIKSHAKWDTMNPGFRQFGNIKEAQEFMMHIDTVPTLSKKIARLQLALSQTLPLLDLSSENINVQVIDDIFCEDKNGRIVCDMSGEPLIHTDGTGFISMDLAQKCPASIFKGKAKVDCNDQEVPLLLQVRLFYKGMVAKGTLLVNLQLPPSTIQVRKSMVKVKSNDKDLISSSHNCLEVCSTSCKPGKGKLSPYLALLLTYGGVPNSVIMNFVDQQLKEVLARFTDVQSALRALKNSDSGDKNDCALRMLLAGMSLEEPYLKKTLQDMAKSQLHDLATGRVTIPNTFNLMGCADPTGKLERNQVVIVLENGPLYSPKVLVYKSPGLHVGDVKVFEATWYKEFEEIIGNGKYVIFFSTKGPRAVVDEIANSDLDGDQYWCCTNSEVVKNFVASSEVWRSPICNKKSCGERVSKTDELEREHFEMFLKARFRPSYTMGMAANNWQAFMDRYLMLDDMDPCKAELWKRIQSLVNTYYDAVDAEKSGKLVFVKEEDKAKSWPHYMDKKQKPGQQWIQESVSYKSITVLGKIYDFVKGRTDSLNFISQLEEKVLNGTFIDKRFMYAGFESCMRKWESLFLEYRFKMKECLSSASEVENHGSEIEAFYEMYRMELYGADTLVDKTVPIEEIYKQASAIYAVVYQSALRKIDSLLDGDALENMQSLGLQFVWKVAGYALLEMLLPQSREKRKQPIFIEESIFRALKFSKRDTV